VVRLLGDPHFARQKGADGRRRVAAEYNWEQCLDRLLQLVENPLNLSLLETELVAAATSRPIPS